MPAAHRPARRTSPASPTSRLCGPLPRRALPPGPGQRHPLPFPRCGLKPLRSQKRLFTLSFENEEVPAVRSFFNPPSTSARRGDVPVLTATAAPQRRSNRVEWRRLRRAEGTVWRARISKTWTKKAAPSPTCNRSFFRIQLPGTSRHHRTYELGTRLRGHVAGERGWCAAHSTAPGPLVTVCSMERHLEGTVALITGASSGIGEKTAAALAADGAQVALVARRGDRLRGLVCNLGDDRALAIEADVTEEPTAATVVAQTVERFGRLDILVNNAGVMLLGPILGAPVDEWQRMGDLNLSALLRCTHAALPHLLRAAESAPRRVADVVNVSSVAGRVARNGSGG